MVVIAGRRVSTPDLIVVGAAAVMLVDSLLPWYGYDASGWHPTYTAFQSGFLAFFPMLFVLLVGGFAATRAWNAADGTPDGAIGPGRLTWNLLYLIADAAAFLLLLLFWATLPGLTGASIGAKIGVYVAIVVTLAQAAGAFLAMVAAGEQFAVGSLRWAKSLRLRRTS